MERLIKHVLDTLAGLGQSEKVALYSIEENGTTAVVSGGFSQGNFVMPGRHVKIEETPLAEILATGEAHTWHGRLLDNLPFPSYENQDSGFECLCMPLLSENEQVIGVAVLSQEVGISQPDYRLHTLTMLRTLVASAMENARLFQLATTDSLTNLYVRRYFEIRLQEEITRVRRHGGDLSILLLDIDHFKRINDTHGHQQGDCVLQVIGEILLASTRIEIDLPCRYGGEEFIVLLPNTRLDGAYILAERIRKRCEQYLFYLENGKSMQVTISIGASAMDQDSNLSREELIRRADLMLYAAKQAGRNQVMKYNR